MQQLRNMGSIKKMIAMLPGAGAMRQQLDNFDEREIVRTEAIIQSMTHAERVNPKVLNGSRRLRVARGSGMTVTDVNQLVTRFEQAAKMMKTVAKGGVPNIPGMGPVVGAGRASTRRAQKKHKGSRSGNPAKRAAENAAASVRGTGAGPAEPTPSGAGFGLGPAGAAGRDAIDPIVKKMLRH
ncbi:MAG TPA: signal recognition particle protein, partial [Microbacteriaceae bacterium]|nr:signal recognition particle protein [Microbacteriaceae bacterium]